MDEEINLKNKICIICKYFKNDQIFDSCLRKVGKKQLQSFKRASEERLDNFHKILNDDDDFYVHECCRTKYIKSSHFFSHIKHKFSQSK